MTLSRYTVLIKYFRSILFYFPSPVNWEKLISLEVLKYLTLLLVGDPMWSSCWRPNVVVLLETPYGRLVGYSIWSSCWRPHMVVLLETPYGRLVGDFIWTSCWRLHMVILLETPYGRLVWDTMSRDVNVLIFLDYDRVHQKY